MYKEYIWHSIKKDKTVGILHEDPHEEFIEIAEPVTNPNSTTMFKAIIAMKTRNPIIFAFHPSAQQCSVAAAKILRDAAIKAGAPENCIQWIEKPSVEATKRLMNHEGVALVLATGGAGMVKSAYSTGKPALGVGPGNVPCYLEKSAHVKRAVNDLILSKTLNKELQKQFGLRMKACRLIVNSPSAQGGIGDIYNAFIPSLTLGCGSYGKNSVSQNVTATHLINVKRLANRKNNMQWFKLPPKVFFEKHATQYLAKMPNILRAFIVTDSGMIELGYVNTVTHYLQQHLNDVKVGVFSEVEPDPSDETVFKGGEMMRSFKPDVIIALGGGSAMDAAKGMWLFYEYPETTFFGIKQKFLYIRKRTCKFLTLG